MAKTIIRNYEVYKADWFCVPIWLALGAQIAVKMLCLGVSVKVSPEQISNLNYWTEWSRWPLNTGGHHPVCWGPNSTKKMKEGQICLLCLCRDIHPLLSLDTGAPGSWVGVHRSGLSPPAPQYSGPFGLKLNSTTSFPHSPACRCRSWDSLASINCESTSRKTTSYIHLYVSYSFYFSGKPWLYT